MNIASIGMGMVADAHVVAIKSSKNGFNLRGALRCDPAKKTNLSAENTTHASRSILDCYQVNSADFVVLATPPIAQKKTFETLVLAGKPILMEKPIERNIPVAVQND